MLNLVEMRAGLGGGAGGKAGKGLGHRHLQQRLGAGVLPPLDLRFGQCLCHEKVFAPRRGRVNRNNLSRA